MHIFRINIKFTINLACNVYRLNSMLEGRGCQGKLDHFSHSLDFLLIYSPEFDRNSVESHIALTYSIFINHHHHIRLCSAVHVHRLNSKLTLMMFWKVAKLSNRYNMFLCNEFDAAISVYFHSLNKLNIFTDETAPVNLIFVAFVKPLQT